MGRAGWGCSDAPLGLDTRSGMGGSLAVASRIHSYRAEIRSKKWGDSESAAEGDAFRVEENYTADKNFG